ncbi:hypothetical protein M8C21_029237, partial [Ambrosia artemisiifolia]
RSPDNRSPAEENGHSRSPSPVARDNGTPIEDEDVVNNGSPDPSESAANRDGTVTTTIPAND